MTRLQTLGIGFVLACAFSLILNLQSLRSLGNGELSIAHFGGVSDSADEVYFFALIKEARDGFLQMGNASLIDHRNAPSLTGYALLPQALLARYTSLKLTTIILLGDFVFPAVIAFLVFLIAARLFGRMPEAILFSLAFLAQWHISFLRTMNPQVTIFVFFLYLFLFVSDDDCRLPLRRGLTISVAILMQPIIAALLLVIEGLDACKAAIRGASFLKVLRKRWILFCVPVIAGMSQYLWVSLHADSQILVDLSARRGLIPTHLPSAPKTSFLLLILGSLWLFRLLRLKDRSVLVQRMLIFATAGLIVLNQQIIHGHEAIFALYYRMPLAFFLALLIFLLVREYCKRWVLLCVLCVSLLFYGVRAVPTIRSLWQQNLASAESFSGSDMPNVLASLSVMKGERVILAPVEISNLVPVLTPHYTLFTQYAHYEYVSDVELAQRFLLLNHFFPLPAVQVVEGDPVVFGLYAGNLYAKEKTFCRLLHRFSFSDRDCNAKKLSDYIRHQDVRAFIEKGTFDAQEMLQKYYVDTVISAEPLPEILAFQCQKSGSSGEYTIYDCDFR